MYSLIERSEPTVDVTRRDQWIDFVRLKREERIEKKRSKPKKPKAPELPPLQPQPPILVEIKPIAKKIVIPSVYTETHVDLTDGFNLALGEGGHLPIVKVAPVYPRRALSRNIEGYCVVEFTVTESGSVKDVQVVKSECTSALFKDASVKAAMKFRYKPRVINGTALEVRGVRNKFTYRIVK